MCDATLTRRQQRLADTYDLNESDLDSVLLGQDWQLYFTSKGTNEFTNFRAGDEVPQDFLLNHQEYSIQQGLNNKWWERKPLRSGSFLQLDIQQRDKLHCPPPLSQLQQNAEIANQWFKITFTDYGEVRNQDKKACSNPKNGRAVEDLKGCTAFWQDSRAAKPICFEVQKNCPVLQLKELTPVKTSMDTWTQMVFLHQKLKT